MLTELEIKEFEKKVVKTFCAGYLDKAFCFISIDETEAPKIESIRHLIEFLNGSKLQGKILLYELWIDSTFEGFEKSIEKCLLNFPPEERNKYRDNAELKKSKYWLYEVFLEIHQSLLKINFEMCEVNKVTGIFYREGTIRKINLQRHS